MDSDDSIPVMDLANQDYQVTSGDIRTINYTVFRSSYIDHLFCVHLQNELNYNMFLCTFMAYARLAS